MPVSPRLPHAGGPLRAPALLVAPLILVLLVLWPLHRGMLSIYAPLVTPGAGGLAGHGGPRGGGEEANTIITLMTGQTEPRPFRRLVDGLRDRAGYRGHIIIGVSGDLTAGTRDYLAHKRVIVHSLLKGGCDEGVMAEGAWMQQLQWCAQGFPKLTMETGRFEFYRRWIEACETCTGWVLVSDSRDIIMQSNPFEDFPPPNKADKDLFLFGEFDIANSHWFTKKPLERCYDLKQVNFTGGWENEAMLCSGTTMGTRQGMLRYLNVMVAEFLLNVAKGNQGVQCLSSEYTDQAPHNLLYYTGRFGPNATRLLFGEGPVLTVGTYCLAKNALRMDADDNVLHPISGGRVPVVHQWDRCWNDKEARWFSPEDHGRQGHVS